jgi:hypothetical protein
MTKIRNRSPLVIPNAFLFTDGSFSCWARRASFLFFRAAFLLCWMTTNSNELQDYLSPMLNSHAAMPQPHLVLPLYPNLVPKQSQDEEEFELAPVMTPRSNLPAPWLPRSRSSGTWLLGPCKWSTGGARAPTRRQISCSLKRSRCRLEGGE